MNESSNAARSYGMEKAVKSRISIITLQLDEDKHSCNNQLIFNLQLAQ
jgi:hypothetical protein